jgi:hypothetical protein
VECAASVQERRAAANAALPDAQQFRFRVGIHVGDVIFKKGDLFGDGVNIAASPAPPLASSRFRWIVSLEAATEGSLRVGNLISRGQSTDDEILQATDAQQTSIKAFC